MASTTATLAAAAARPLHVRYGLVTNTDLLLPLPLLAFYVAATCLVLLSLLMLFDVTTCLLCCRCLL
jgi:hypothetical protein